MATVVDPAAIFEAAIDRAVAAGRPADLANARQVYADWLDERSTEADGRLAAAQRWMARWGRCPMPSKERRGMRAWHGPESGYRDERSCLPTGVFRRLAGTPQRVVGDSFKRYLTRRDAERALAEALAAAPVDAAG